MRGYNFTERVRKVLQIAQAAAAEMKHGPVAPEHMLLGIAREGEGVAIVALAYLGVEKEPLLDAMMKRMPPPLPDSQTPTRMQQTYTEDGMKVLELAMAEARGLDHQYVGSEHLLLGILRVPESTAATVLADFGIDLETARAQIMKILGGTETLRVNPAPNSSAPREAAEAPTETETFVVRRGTADRQQQPRGRMNGYNFTERVRQALAFAREEAAQLRHGYVAPEHVLLGIIREGEGVAVTVVQNLGVDTDALRAEVLRRVRPAADDGPSGPDLPYTSRAKKSLEYAMSEARTLNHAYVGTEHLFLGLLREKSGLAAEVLVDLGITLDKARAETLRILGGGVDDDGAYAQTDPPATERTRRPGLASLGDPIRSILIKALEIAKEHQRSTPDVADLLSALIFSSREVAAAFAARDIEPHGLIDEIRKLTDDE